ncbi:competence protein CglB [Leuconostoc litchii]|uniref:Type II secretion system protein F n=1 Tax=Leuconostoc litchii TaxID=1981069 RepID=A0A6P2CQQ6_9LACO|nr:type II secretion system F family protein [Leuconostoc litchii]TYC47452.1 type II secretion system protein F [Leuconostoc litchii]GMA69470.1 competence protein CglB [Leuconostoc litchii]
MQLIKSLSRFKKQDQVLFFQELGELLGSGYSIAQSIDILVSAHQNWQSILHQVQNGLENGQTLHDTLTQYVSAGIALQLKLAHQHGDVSATLIRIGESLAKFQQQQSKVAQVMRYPIILIGILTLMLLGLKYFLYPMLNQWRETSEITPHYSSFMFFCIGLIIITLALLSFLYWHRLLPLQKLNYLSTLPFLGSMVRTIVTYQISQQLSMLMFSGLTLPEIVDEIAKHHRRSYAVSIAQDIKKHLKNGEDVERYILSKQFINKSLAGYFIRGHQPKILAQYLDYYAKTQFRLLMQQTDRFIGTLQPVFFGIIGIAIVGLYMSMLLPMYQTIGGLYQ